MVVGSSVRRKDGAEKLTGRARYVDDLVVPGMLHGRTVRTTVARGRLERIDFDPALPWDEIAVVTAADVPGTNRVKLIDLEQPFLVEREIRHREAPVVLLAHADRDLLARAVQGVRLVVTPEEPVLSLDESRTEFLAHTLETGDLAVGFAEADVVVEGVYETGAQEHVYIEPQGMLAEPRPGGGVTVRGSLQCPYYVQPAVALLLGVPPEQVQVIQTTTGGGFGGKEEYPSIIAGHAALLAVKSGRPVKLVYDRMEDMTATTKRHPSRIRHRVGVTRDGRLTALETELVLDGGAYLTLSPVVLSRAMIHAAGPYRWPCARVRGRVMAHQLSAARGLPRLRRPAERPSRWRCTSTGCAKTLGLDPVELRRRNLLRPGDTTATGQAVDPDIDVVQILDAALAESRLPRQAGGDAAANARSPHVKRGDRTRGVHARGRLHGERRDHAGLAGGPAARRGRDGGDPRLDTEIGQGASTTHPQIVSEVLGLPYEMVVSAARHRRGAGQRADGGLPHGHGRGRAAGARGGAMLATAARAAARPRRTDEDFRSAARRYAERARAARHHGRARAAGRRARGTTRSSSATRTRATPGPLRGRGGRGHAHRRGRRDRLPRGPGGRARDPPGCSPAGRSRVAWRRASASRSTSTWCGATG